jgi:hypothetical protein
MTVHGCVVHVPSLSRVNDTGLHCWQDLETFWKGIQGRCKLDSELADTFFSSSWLHRAADYRQVAEPLDIAQWYYREKNFDDKQRPSILGNHYITGTNPLDGDDKEYLFDAAGQAVAVKDNKARPGRYQMIQERELGALRAAGRDLSAGSPALASLDSLGLARLMTTMGLRDAGISFNADISKWPAAVRVRPARFADSIQHDPCVARRHGCCMLYTCCCWCSNLNDG